MVQFFFLLFIISSAHSRDLNFIESHLLRLSSSLEAEHWLLPFNNKAYSRLLDINFFVSGHQKDIDLYQDINSKNQERIQGRLESSYGRPYDASAKINLAFHFENITQSFSTNAGAVMVVSDPVFPELKALFFHDYLGASSYLFRPFDHIIFRPQISYGFRRLVDRQYSIANLVNKSYSANLSEVSYKGFAEMSFLGILGVGEWGKVIIEGNSLPVSKQDHNYWDTFLGFKTNNLLSTGNFNLYAGYSPLYGGEYDVSRTYKIGANIKIAEFFKVDLFTMDKFYPAAIVTFLFNYLEFSLSTFERSYDDYGTQKSRQYAMTLKFQW